MLRLYNPHQHSNLTFPLHAVQITTSTQSFFCLPLTDQQSIFPDHDLLCHKHQQCFLQWLEHTQKYNIHLIFTVAMLQILYIALNYNVQLLLQVYTCTLLFFNRQRIVFIVNVRVRNKTTHCAWVQNNFTRLIPSNSRFPM